MTRKTIGIIMNGVTGRMGTNQHLVRSILAIREQGGIPLPNGDQLWPEPTLVGRNESKLSQLAETHGVSRYSTDLNACLADKSNTIYFDAQTTSQRGPALRAAIEAGKHIYCEKPVADTLAETLELARLAKARGVKHGVVQDKLFLPGIRKLKRLIDGGFFGRILAVRGDFGYWVFEGDWQPSQRPSWNYRSEEGGGIIVDMLCHWRYVLDHTFGPVKRVSCFAVSQIPERWDESGKKYKSTAEDAAYASFQLDGGIFVHMNTSWNVRPYQDEILQIHVDGTHGSAVAGLRDCRVQHRANTPKPVWNPDIPNPIDFRAGWQLVPDNQVFENAFKVQWEMFIKHVELGTPFVHDLIEGAKGIQLAEIAHASWREGKWLDVPDIAVPNLES